jgi:hypothetical protein
VRLLDIDPQDSRMLPPLTPIDLRWFQDPAFYRTIEESLEQQPRFIGSFYHDLFITIPQLDLSAVRAELDKYTTGILNK